MHFTGPFELDDLAEREFVLTNGLGGYASATLCGMMTRRYHGLLVAARHPPGDRTLLVAKLEETVLVDEEAHDLATNEYRGTVHPRGYRCQTAFALEGDEAVMGFAVAGATLEKRIAVVTGENTTRVTYRNTGDRAITLRLSPLVNARDFHGETASGHIGFEVRDAALGAGAAVQVVPHWLPEGFWLVADAGTWRTSPDWYHDMLYRWESRRGLTDVDSHFAPGQFTVPLDPGATVTITLSALPPDAAGAPTPAATTAAPPDSTPEIARLYRTADSFLVRRGQVAGAATEGSTIIAGYHWFGDWGRDTMIALPGCCLTTGRHAIAGEILRTFAATRRRGLLPNLFLEYGGEAYNTIDAALWFVHAVDRYVAATGDLDLAREVWPALMEIITYYRDGTDFGIRMDADGLILADAPGWQLTWMDAKIGDWVVTPRMGKAVEINALWYHDLRIMAEFAARLGLEDIFTPMADRAREAFDAFWYAEGGYLYDVLGATPDAAIRPNQIFAVSLPHSPLDDARARAVVEVVTRELLTPVGLRSLSPRDPAYRGHYGGDVWSRDGSYHQGTVWGWLIGPYVDAYLRVHSHSAEAKAAMRAHLGTLLAHVHDAGVGSVSEIFDGDAPHYPKGTVSQAWSVAEVLRAWEASQ